jgi:glycosidase
MQWSATRNGGFSTARAADLVSPVTKGAFAPAAVNAEDQRSDPDSLHSFMRSLIRAYRECPELGWGEFTLLGCDAPSVLAHRCSWQDRAVVAVHNLAAEPVTARVTLPEGTGPVRLAEPLGDVRLETDKQGRFTVRLPRYGRLWLQVTA